MRCKSRKCVSTSLADSHIKEPCLGIRSSRGRGLRTGQGVYQTLCVLESRIPLGITEQESNMLKAACRGPDAPTWEGQSLGYHQRCCFLLANQERLEQSDFLCDLCHVTL